MLLISLHVFALIATATVASASPAGPSGHPQFFDVYSPPITSPKEGAVWKVGRKYLVTWDTSGIPRDKTGTTGLVLLGHDDPPYHASNNGTIAPIGSENLDIKHPLATGFPIDSGCVTVNIPPKTVPRDDYFLVLFGDSGNKSPKFKIRKA